jgi:hypothetical protein
MKLPNIITSLRKTDISPDEIDKRKAAIEIIIKVQNTQS